MGARRSGSSRTAAASRQNAHGDTYGPAAYEAYLPGYLVLGWKGKGDRLNAAHLTSILFDFACLIGLALVGWRYGGRRLAATLAFAWASYPFTQYVASSNSNDAIQAALLVFGFWLASSAWARGSLVGLASLGEVRPLVLFPLWAHVSRRGVPGTVPSRSRPRSPRPRWRRSGSCCSRATRSAPCRRSGTGRSRTRSSGTRRSRSGTGGSTTPACRTSTSSSGCSRACWWLGAVLAGVQAAEEVTAPAGRPERRPADRLRDRADALVLPLRRVVLPLRGVRAALRAGRLRVELGMRGVRELPQLAGDQIGGLLADVDRVVADPLETA